MSTTHTLNDPQQCLLPPISKPHQPPGSADSQSALPPIHTLVLGLDRIPRKLAPIQLHGRRNSQAMVTSPYLGHPHLAPYHLDGAPPQIAPRSCVCRVLVPSSVTDLVHQCPIHAPHTQSPIPELGVAALRPRSFGKTSRVSGTGSPNGHGISNGNGNGNGNGNIDGERKRKSVDWSEPLTTATEPAFTTSVPPSATHVLPSKPSPGRALKQVVPVTASVALHTVLDAGASVYTPLVRTPPSSGTATHDRLIFAPPMSHAPNQQSQAPRKTVSLRSISPHSPSGRTPPGAQRCGRRVSFEEPGAEWPHGHGYSIDGPDPKHFHNVHSRAAGSKTAAPRRPKPYPRSRPEELLPRRVESAPSLRWHAGGALERPRLAPAPNSPLTPNFTLHRNPSPQNPSARSSVSSISSFLGMTSASSAGAPPDLGHLPAQAPPPPPPTIPFATPALDNLLNPTGFWR